MNKSVLLISLAASFFGHYNCQTTCAPRTLDPNVYCFDCLMRANNRDIFANPVDCHTYFQCFYLNETRAKGILKHCGPGAYFDESRLTCRAEGPVPCQPSPCSNPTIASIGCYQLPGQSCREYFTCTFNETRCCPMNTRFNPNTCGCVNDTTCRDFCLALPQAMPPPTSNLTACTDSFGNTLTAVPGRPDVFRLGEYNLSCAMGTTFNLSACGCATPITYALPTTGGRQCKVWLPFDTDLMDKSTNEFVTFAYGNAMLDVTTSASGRGSLLVNTGHLEIPGMKTMEFANPLGPSLCFSFRCQCSTTVNPYGCNRNGGIISNNRDGTVTAYSIIAAISGMNSLVSRIQTENSTISFTTPVNTPTSGWNSVCYVYAKNESEVRLYLNGALQATSPPVYGTPIVTHCPYVVGNDQFYGSFVGNIDNVLVCDTPLTPAEVQAHYTGNIAALVAADLIP